MKEAPTRLACIASMLLALAACGGSDDPAPSPAPSPTPAPTPAPAPNPNGPLPIATPAGSPQGTSTSASLGSAGGRLSSSDGKLKITVPAGALSGPATLSIQPVGNGAPGRIGTGYRLLPEGIAFAKPVQLSFSYTEADVAGSSAEALGVATQQASGTWRWQDGTLDSASRTVTANTTHFSDWSLVKGFQLRPPTATVKPGGTVPLRLAYCFAPQVGDDDLVPIGYECDGQDAPAPVNWSVNWSVNGTPGGSASSGTVAGNGNSATYTAPTQAPSANPVAVSAEVQGLKGKVIVVANITILDADYTGSVLWTMQDPIDKVTYRSSNIAWKQQRLPDGRPVVTPGGDAIFEAIGGTLDITISRPDCTDVQSTVPVTTGILQVHGGNSEVGASFQHKYYFFLGNPNQVSGTSTCQPPGTSASTVTLHADALISLEDQCAPDSSSPELAPPWFPGYTDRAILAGQASWSCEGRKTDQTWRFTQ